MHRKDIVFSTRSNSHDDVGSGAASFKGHYPKQEILL